MTWKAEPICACFRRKTRFLIFPKKIDGVWKWLEVATWGEEYKRVDNVCGVAFKNHYFKWTPIIWCKKESEQE